MTLSLHKYGDFFPGTGALEDVGTGAGKYYSVNVPLNDGCNDATFELVFKPVMREIVARFKPEAI
jgi:histone deacetylase 1/2